MLYLVDAVGTFSTTEAREHDSPSGSLCSLTRKQQVAGDPKVKRARWSARCGFRWWKGYEGIGRISNPGVLRLRARSAVSFDKFVRRFAQDDDFVGVLKKSIP